MGLTTPALLLCIVVAASACGGGPSARPADGPRLRPGEAPRFSVGRAATSAEIVAWDKDINGAGDGLPPGQGLADDGARIYKAQCASCHGPRGEGGTGAQLIKPHAPADRPRRNIASHWPYAGPLFDYIRRTMPPDRPWSLRDDEVYALVAYLLAENAIIPPTMVLNARTLRRVTMPSKDRFIADDRAGGPHVK